MTPERPLVVYDLEATGVNTAIDRVTQIAAIKIWPGEDVGAAVEMLERSIQQGGNMHEDDRLISYTINPQTTVKPFVLELTHLTQEELNASCTFEQWAPFLHMLFGNAVKDGEDYGKVDLAGFNSNKFDNLMLCAEFERCGYEYSLDGRNLLDAYSIYAKNEGRRLVDAMQLYCGKDISEVAHNALVDISATLQVFLGQEAKYEDMPADNAGIAEYGKKPNWIDMSGKFLWEGDVAVMGFGKHVNTPLETIARTQAGFLRWMIGKDFPADAETIAKQALQGIFPQKDN